MAIVFGVTEHLSPFGWTRLALERDRAFPASAFLKDMLIRLSPSNSHPELAASHFFCGGGTDPNGVTDGNRAVCKGTHAGCNSYRFSGYTASGVYLRYTLNAQNAMRRGTTSEKLKQGLWLKAILDQDRRT